MNVQTEHVQDAEEEVVEEEGEEREEDDEGSPLGLEHKPHTLAYF